MKHLYTFIRNIVPSSWHGYLTYLIYFTGLKPSINKAVKSPFIKGIVVLSADFEMAWAFRYSKKRGHIAEEMGRQERENVPILLYLFEKYSIPVTWATVGHLFLDNCYKDKKLKAHPEMPRPAYFENRNWNYTKGDWYEADPCSDVGISPAWYAPDLIEKIIQSPVKHEIGCHTFSHIDCTDKNCTTELLQAELQACIDIAAKKGIKLKSMVFPGGTLGNYSILKEMGFTSFRKYMKYHIDIPVLDNFGLVQIPSSFTLDKSRYGWSAMTHIRMANAFVLKAAKHKMVAHLWFHPSMDKWYLDEVLPEVLANIRKMVDQGKVEVLTMEQLASRTLSLQNDKPNV
jgi:peptidoglycan/xylan/chitin deacetylase (PgdA/CDA1 family)